MTSNMLNSILGLKGEVIIGDRALKEYLKCGKEAFWDLGEIWHERTNLPFVFGRFCYIKNGEIYKKIAHSFLQKRVKFPSYIIEKYAKTRGVGRDDILWYLGFISYEIDKKANLALKKFFRDARKFNYKPKV